MYTIRRYEFKYRIIGPNGCGKTTLMNIIYNQRISDRYNLCKTGSIGIRGIGIFSCIKFRYRETKIIGWTK